MVTLRNGSYFVSTLYLYSPVRGQTGSFYSLSPCELFFHTIERVWGKHVSEALLPILLCVDSRKKVPKSL